MDEADLPIEVRTGASPTAARPELQTEHPE
jgi:hypothetical protein